jgi:hypothetical protein
MTLRSITTRKAVNFKQTNPFSYHGMRTFRRIGIRDQIRADGSHTQLTVWQARCMICDMEIMTPARVTKATSQSKSLNYITCPAHRLTPSEISRLRRAKIADRAAVFAEIRAAKTGCPGPGSMPAR